MKSRPLVLLGALLLPFAASAELRLASPAPDATVHSNQGQVSVEVLGAPPDARFIVLLDGQPYGEVRSASRFVIDGVHRGTHRLEVARVDESGRELERSAAVEFHVWQASRLFPNRQGAQ